MRRYITVICCILVLVVYILVAVCTEMTVSVIAENKTAELKKTIVIDAGHGGEDGGAISCTGALESEINLEISLRLKDLLNLLGYRTILTRLDDCSIHTNGETIAQRKVSDLNNRVNLVNSTENALLLSIHQNYFADNRYLGAQVFYANTTGSHCLAESIQNCFRNTINQGSNRMAKKAENIFIMDKIDCDGVLIECGFLSNYQEDALLRNAEYQKKVSTVIASAVSVYLCDSPLPA